jgi:hypothetical protein
MSKHHVHWDMWCSPLSDIQLLVLHNANNSKYAVNLQLYYALELPNFSNSKYRINPRAQNLMKLGTRNSTNHRSEPNDTTWNCAGDDHITLYLLAICIVIIEMRRISQLFLTCTLNIDTHQMLRCMMVLAVVKVCKRIM